jgi:phage gp37-like protein
MEAFAVLTIAEIEEAIIARLGAELPYLRTCSSLGSFLARDPKEVAGLTPLCPAVYVVYQGAEYSHRMAGVQDRAMTFNAVALVRNLRGEPAPRHGQGVEKGVYEVLEDVRAALTGRDCGIQIDPLLPVSEQAITGARDLAVYGISFRTRCRTQIGD